MLMLRRVIMTGVCVLAAPAAAQMYGSDYGECSAATSTVAIVDCVAKKAAVWDGRLNKAYRALQQRIMPQQSEPLKGAQRLWIRYRDANCGFYASQDGTIRQIEAAECLRSMTQQRTCELEAASRGEGGISRWCQ